MAMLLSSTVCTYLHVCTCIYDVPVPIGRAYLYSYRAVHVPVCNLAPRQLPVLQSVSLMNWEWPEDKATCM